VLVHLKEAASKPTLRDRKAAIQHRPRPQLTRVQLSHQISKLQAAATTIQTNRLTLISQLDHRLAQLAIHLNLNVQLVQDSRAHKLVLVLQVHKQDLHLIHKLDVPKLVLLLDRLILPLDRLNVPQDSLLLNKDQQQLVSAHHQVDNSREVTLVAAISAAATVAAAVLHRRANKTKAKKAITLPFPASQKRITQSSPRSQRRPSTATNRNIRATMLTLRLVAKSSTFAL